MPWPALVPQLLKLLVLTPPLLYSPQALYPALQWAQHQGLQGLPSLKQLKAPQRLLAWKAQDAHSSAALHPLEERWELCWLELQHTEQINSCRDCTARLLTLEPLTNTISGVYA